MARGLPTGGQGSKVYVLCAEPKEYKHFRPGTRPGGSVTGVTEKLFMFKTFRGATEPSPPDLPLRSRPPLPRPGPDFDLILTRSGPEIHLFGSESGPNRVSPKLFRPKFFHGRPRGMSEPKCLFFPGFRGPDDPPCLLEPWEPYIPLVSKWLPTDFFFQKGKSAINLSTIGPKIITLHHVIFQN